MAPDVDAIRVYSGEVVHQGDHRKERDEEEHCRDGGGKDREPMSASEEETCDDSKNRDRQCDVERRSQDLVTVHGITYLTNPPADDVSAEKVAPVRSI